MLKNLIKYGFQRTQDNFERVCNKSPHLLTDLKIFNIITYTLFIISNCIINNYNYIKIYTALGYIQSIIKILTISI